MSDITPSKSPLPLIFSVIAIGAAVTTALVVKDPVKLAGITFVAAVGGAGVLYAFPPRRRPTLARLGQAELAPLLKGVAENRVEILNAMRILQEEIRILQDAKISETESAALRTELSRLTGEVATLKRILAAAPAPAAAPVVKPAPVVIVADEEDDGDFDVAPLSFDDEEDAAPAPKAAVTFAPEPEPVVETGLAPEDMEDDGDWLTGGLDEEDLIVTKKVDFEAIVQKDAARPKPKVDEQEQRILREEMAQMADEDDWVGAGLEDRDVKVKAKTTTANDALFDKLRAEIEAKRAAQQSSAAIRPPARGETALLVNFTVSNGAKLFIRGVGPGLDVDKGVPMQQSGHGKWQWICQEKGKPCVVTVWENDELQAEGNPVRVPGGFALTVTPTFRRKLRL